MSVRQLPEFRPNDLFEKAELAATILAEVQQRRMPQTIPATLPPNAAPAKQAKKIARKKAASD